MCNDCSITLMFCILIYFAFVRVVEYYKLIIIIVIVIFYQRVIRYRFLKLQNALSNNC